MSLGILIEILSLALAIGGLLLQTRRDPSKTPSWYNLSNGGRLILLLIVATATIKIIKNHLDSEAQREARKVSDAKIEQLQTTNERLIQVMSVSSGYNALLSGYVLFDEVPTQFKVEEALRNLFLKYAEVEIKATNFLGTHNGRVDYGAHPEIRRFLSFERIRENPKLLQLRELVVAQDQPKAFYFEIRCANLKILNQNNIQYTRLDKKDHLQVSAKVFDYWNDFRSLYDVKSLYLDQLTIEELGEMQIQKEF